MLPYRLFTLFTLWCFAFSVYADIGVSPIVVDLMGKEADAEVAVKNFDTQHNAYVEIIPYSLTNPERQNALKQRVRHPEQDGLIVFPSKLILLPGQTQFVRIVKTANSVSVDKVYEVDFIPKVTTHLVSQKNPNGPALGIRVIVGYGARVTLRPEILAPALVIERNKKQLFIKNTGNTSLSLMSCTQDISGHKTEIVLPAYTLFVGQMIKKELAHPTKVTLDVAVMGKRFGTFYTD